MRNDRTPQWHKTHQAELTEYMRRYRAEHRDILREAARVRRINNRDKILAQAKALRDAHPSLYSLYRANDRKKHLQRITSYRRAHLEADRERSHQRRVKQRPSKVSHQAVYDRDKGRCHVCGKSVDRQLMSLDHIVPLSRDGSHTFENVRCSHRTCNFRRTSRGPGQPYLL